MEQKDGINTFQDKISKDLVVDDSKTFDFILPQKSIDSVLQIILDVDFFSYPNIFEPDSYNNKNYTDACGYRIEYYLKVSYHGKIKELIWVDILESSDEKALALRKAIKKIIEIIQNTKEYQALPEARGAYL